jgi:uncharacterized protein
MYLDLSQMRGTRDRVDRTYEPLAFETRDDAVRVVAPVHLTLDVFKNRGQVRLVGRVVGMLELACARCLESFTFAVDAAFDLLYLPQTANTGQGDLEVIQEDLGTAYYRDETIDLGGLMQEQFYLSLPMKPLCADTCLGLCPRCGTNRNTATCACTRTNGDPRLAGLRSIVGRGGGDLAH